MYFCFFMKREEDQYLWELLKEGDENAFSEIYDRFWDKLYYVAYQKVRNSDVAEGLVQEVFLLLWKKREDLSINNLSHYLAAMLRYSVYRHLASEKAMREREDKFVNGQEQVAFMEDAIANKLILDKIIELSNQLPEKCRLVFQYNKLQDQSLQNVAKELNISQKTAEAHLTKALKTIRLSMRGFLHFFI